MKINIDLRHLSLTNIEFSDDTFKYNNKILKTMSGELSVFIDYFNTLENMFFQEEATITIDTLYELDVDTVIFETQIASLMFNRMDMAYATLLSIRTGNKYKLNDLIESSYGPDDPCVYDVEDGKYQAYYINQMMTYAKDYLKDYFSEVDLEQVFGDEYELIHSYWHYIDVDSLASSLISYCKSEDLEINDSLTGLDLVNEFLDNHKSESELVWSYVINEDLFDFDSYIDELIKTPEKAITEIANRVGAYVTKIKPVIPNMKTKMIYIFEEI